VRRTLLLNATFEPLCVVSLRRAVVLVLKGKAEIVARDVAEIHSARMNVPCPSVSCFHEPPMNDLPPSTRPAKSGWL